VEYVQEVVEVVPEPVYIYSPSVVVSHHRSHNSFHKPRRFRHQPAGLPEGSSHPSFSTPPLPLSQPPPFPSAAPQPRVSTSPLPLHKPPPFPFASPQPRARR
jgi:hypothetical protein